MKNAHCLLYNTIIVTFIGPTMTVNGTGIRPITRTTCYVYERLIKKQLQNYVEW